MFDDSKAKERNLSKQLMDGQRVQPQRSGGTFIGQGVRVFTAHCGFSGLIKEQKKCVCVCPCVPYLSTETPPRHLMTLCTVITPTTPLPSSLSKPLTPHYLGFSRFPFCWSRFILIFLILWLFCQNRSVGAFILLPCVSSALFFSCWFVFY